MPFVKAATNGTGERACVWRHYVGEGGSTTLDAIFEWQLVTKYNDKVKRALKKEEKKGAKAEDDEEEEEEEETGPVPVPEGLKTPATPVGWRPKLWPIWQMDGPTSTGGCHKLLEVKVGLSKQVHVSVSLLEVTEIDLDFGRLGAPTESLTNL